jgi:polyisoprenyl-teichoic acid--peptidoglycan teichoic acid transferase
LWAVALLIIIGLGTILASGAWLFRTVQAMAAEWQVTTSPQFTTAETTASSPGSTPLPPAITTSGGQGEPSAEEEPLPTLPPPQQWTGVERVTILLLGIDQRCDETGPTRTDTMMLLTVDPVGKTAGILSLPRDLWVQIPGFRVDRINQAHYLGEANSYPGGGPALAQKTVEATLGVRVDYYVTINFDGVVEGIDLLGGIEIDVPEAINDTRYPDSCYGYDPFQIGAGRQSLTGEQALKYARTRITAGGDVDRAGRQQAVVLALREKALGQFSSLLLQAPQLWRTAQDNIRTTLTLDEALQLALLMQEISAENIYTAVIDFKYVYPERTPNGDEVLVPIRENIRALRDELFAPPAPPAAVIPDLPEKMAAEKARIAVYNGTPIFGLAGSTQTYLQAYGFTVTSVGNADSAAYPATQIIDFGQHPYTTQYLVQLMGLPPLNVSQGSRPDGDYDVLIILGNDWDVPRD